MTVATAPPLPLVTPGCQVIYGQSDPAYRAAEGVSQSEIKEILKSAAHYKARYGPGADPSFPSAAMIIGTATHAMVLEPERFDSLFCNRAEVAKDPTVTELKASLLAAGIEFKSTAKKDELLALMYPDGLPKETRTTLAPDDFEAVKGMAEALRNHTKAGAWFNHSRRNYSRGNEISIYVSAEVSPLGIAMKGRIDRLERTPTGWRILDLKTTNNASPDEFMRKSWDLSYDVQAAYYSMITALALGGDVDFIFCAVERLRPHGIGLYRASGALIDSGLKKIGRGAAELAFCRSNDIWPGYSEEILNLGLPAWAKDPKAEPLQDF